jgi:glutamate racemase
LFDKWCDHVIIACNTATASIYKHRFELDKEKRLISVTKSWLKEVIKYDYQNIAVFCTQATHDLQVYQHIYQELWWNNHIYTIPTPELVPLIEHMPLDREKVKSYMNEYKKYLDIDTDCLILWCTHYPIILDIIWESFPQLKIIDPWRNSIFTIAKRLLEKWCNKTHWRWSISIECTWSKKKFYSGSSLIYPTIPYEHIKQISI